jgi:hypothetical protein
LAAIILKIFLRFLRLLKNVFPTFFGWPDEEGKGEEFDQKQRHSAAFAVSSW